MQFYFNANMAQVGKQKLTLTPRPDFAKEWVYSVYYVCIVGLFESMQDLHVMGRKCHSNIAMPLRVV